MMTGNLPFSGKDHKEIASEIIKHEPDYKNEILSHLSKGAIDFLKSKILL
jgi:hypothetical protein